MAGKSQQEKAAESYYKSVGSFGDKLSGINTNIANPYKDYTQPFDYNAKSSAIDKLYGSYLEDINRTAASDSAQAGQGVMSRLASGGVTSGSILEDSISKAQNNVNKNKFNSISQLKSARLGLTPQLMDSENQSKLAITDRGYNADIQNLINEMRKYGMIQSNLGMQGSAIQGLSDDTWLSDFLSIADLASKFLPKDSGGNAANAAMGGG